MLPSVREHQVGCPVLQARQVPQAARVAITTWSPGLTERTSEPTDSTTPAPSWPRTTGGGKGMVPSMTERSEWHTPAAPMRTATSLGPGAAHREVVGDLQPVGGEDDASHGDLLVVAGAPAARAGHRTRGEGITIASAGAASRHGEGPPRGPSPTAGAPWAMSAR